MLLLYNWPGNVRELENAVKRALVLSSAPVLSPADFDFLAGGGLGDRKSSIEEMVEKHVLDSLGENDADNLHRQLIETVERPMLSTVLKFTEGNQIRAAALLGINRNTLRKKIMELEIDLPRKRDGE